MHSYVHFSKKEQNKKIHIQSKVPCIHKCILQKEQIKRKIMHCRASNIHLSTTKIKLHTNQQKILLEKGLNVVSPHFTTRMYNLSDIVQRFIQNL